MDIKIAHKHLSLLLIILIGSSSLVFGQDYYENKQFRLKILKPKNWISATDEDLENSLKKIEFNREQLQKVLESKKGVMTLCSYYKYKTDSVAGLIPTVKITIRNNPAADFSDFKEMMVNSVDRMRTFFQHFEMIDNLKEIKLSAFPSLFCSFRYSVNLASGDTMKVRSRYYMIPYDKYFMSITFMDNETNEDCSQEFDQLINSLELTK